MTDRRVVILGGGFAGLRALYRLHGIDGIELVLVDPSPTSLVKPALPEVALGGKPVGHVRFPLDGVARRTGARFMQAGAERILVPERRVVLTDGTRLEYDFLLIAAGARKCYDAIPGYAEHGHSPCNDAEAVRLSQALKRFEGGPVVIGAARSVWGSRVDVPALAAPCEGPIGEVMFMLDEDLRRRGLRERSSIRVFSPGEVFFEDVGDAVRAALAPIIDEHGIEVSSSKVLCAIHDSEVEFADGERWPSALTVIIPPYAGHPLVAASEGLGDQVSFVPTDPHMRHLDFREIFAAGDGNALAMPKLGHIAVHQADIAAAALRREITGSGEIPDYEPEIFCIMNRGGHSATLILSNRLFGGDVDRALSSPLAHLMKWGFDGYYHHTRGHLPPDRVQEALLKLLG